MTYRSIDECLPQSNFHHWPSKIVLPFLLVFGQILFAQRPSQSPPPQSGLQVKLRLAETVSSANAKVGQRVLLETIEPVQENGKVTIASGAQAQAIVTTARRRGHNRREGQLTLTLQTVNRVDGSQAALQSAIVRQGSGHGMPIFGPCTFPFPADPVGLFRKGKNVEIPKGTELSAAIAQGNP